jgi:signal transduction histidine kinase/ligand-binding sensor domain-containing protein
VIGLGLLPGSAGWSAAQTALRERVHLERLDGRDGLPQNTAFDVIQDRQGFLWVGTNDGLARYDGRTVIAFRHHQNDASSLSHNTVRRLFEDRNHRLWIRTETGLDRYEALNDRFHHYPIQAQQLFEDARGLIVASHAGLHRYDAATDRFEALTPFPLAGQHSPSPDDPVWGLLRSRAGVTWLTTQEGHLFGSFPDGTTRQFQLPWREVTILNEDPEGQLWVGHDAGIAVINPADPTGPRVVPHEPFRLVRGSVIALRHGPDNEVWFGGAALYRTDAQGTAVTEVDIGDDPLATPIRSILIDREGLLWLATPRGLLFHSPYAKRWLQVGGSSANPRSVNPSFAHRTTLGGDAVMAVALGQAHQLWVGTLDGGVDHVVFGPDDTGVVVRQATATGAPCPDHIWTLLSDNVNRLWIGSDHGLCVVETGRQRRIPLTRGTATLSEPVVFTLQQDQTGGLWAGTTAGLFRVDPRTLTSRRQDGIGNARPGSGNIEGLLIAADGSIWAGTSGSDIFRVDPATFDVQFYPLGDSPEFRGSEGFWTLADVGDGRLWLGSDRGLFLFDPGSGSLESVAAQRGMPAAPVYAILRDEQGSLWLSTRSSLLRHDNPLTATPGTALVRQYTTDDGLPFGEFNRRAAVAGPDGWLTFGGMGGIVRFRPGEFRDNPYAPLVQIIDVERARVDGPPQHTRPVGEVVSLAVGDAGLVLHFTAPTFADAHRAQLSYRMEGVDADWVTASVDRRARYPALGAGRYTFRVRAANADGVWNLEGTTLTILVPTPWWATWWFRLSMGLTGVGVLVIGLRRVLTRPLRRRVRALELEQRVRTERERISRDLHDNVGSQVATLLAAIELADLRASRGELALLRHDLADLHDDARRTMTQLRETVWSLRHDHISLHDLIGRVQDDLRNRQRVLAKPELKCTASGDVSIELGSEKALHLFRMVQEAVTNAIRHASATVVHVEVTSDTGIRVSIRDDGTFRPPAAHHRGSGLASMRSRAEEIGAQLAIRGTPDGTSIDVVLPGRQS